MKAVPTKGFTRRMSTSVVLLIAVALVLTGMPAAFAVPTVLQDDSLGGTDPVALGGTPFFPCGSPIVRQTIAQVNEAAPLDIGECEEDENGAWSFVPGEDTQAILDLIPEDVPDPGDDVPDPGDVPGLDELPRHLNCGGYENVENWTDQMTIDADCDGYGNLDELTNGCDPLDPTANPGFPEKCDLLPPDDPDELDSWVAKKFPRSLNCAGHDSSDSLFAQLSTDADCDGYGNLDELTQACNPFNGASTPAFPFTCAPEPDPADPGGSANQTALWAQMQAAWAQGAVLGALPVWLAGIIIWLLDQPDLPE